MNIKYLSTRNKKLRKTSKEILLEGLSEDGGLYLPVELPNFSGCLEKLKKLPYQELAVEILAPFLDEVSVEELKKICEKSYAKFDSPEIAPLITKNNRFILELFHGPTLAFKDFALQLLGNLFENVLAEKNTNLNILGATSGDTGSAAIQAVKGKKGVNVFMLYPQGRVSKIQELQMTTSENSNVHVLAIDGTFDDAQSIVKKLLNDAELKKKRNLGAVNSINFIRILAQTVYYFYAYFQFQKICPLEIPSFSIPTGNFGNVYAGYLAKKMGLPCGKLVVAVNENDILGRCLTSGDYIPKTVHQTIAPSMDIQVASNFERLLFDLSGQNDEKVKEKMNSLKIQNRFKLSEEELSQAKFFFSPVKIRQDTAIQTIQELYEQGGYVLDTHSAIGFAAANRSNMKNCITLATAHPAKFEETIQSILSKGALQKHPSIEALRTKRKHSTVISADLKKIKNYILKNSPVLN